VIDAAVEHFGAVNGWSRRRHDGAGTLLEVTPQMWEEMFNTNVRGPSFSCTVGAAPPRHEEAGSIVNILSKAAHCGQSNLTHYSASKARWQS